MVLDTNVSAQGAHKGFALLRAATRQPGARGGMAAVLMTCVEPLPLPHTLAIPPPHSSVEIAGRVGAEVLDSC